MFFGFVGSHLHSCSFPTSQHLICCIYLYKSTKTWPKLFEAHPWYT